MRFALALTLLVAVTPPVWAQYPAQPSERPPNYRQIIKRAIVEKQEFEKRSAVASTQKVEKTVMISAEYEPFQVSGVRQVDTLEDWSWLVCLKGENRGPKDDKNRPRREYQAAPIYIAVFLRGNRIVETRANVLSDGCGTQQYEKL